LDVNGVEGARLGKRLLRIGGAVLC
jgi:hypothetical protein